MKNKITRSKKQKFNIATLVSMGILIVLAPVFTPKDTFTPNLLNLEETYSYDYVNGSLDLKMIFQQAGWGYSSDTDGLSLCYRIILSTSSIGNLTVNGFTSYQHTIDVNSYGKGSTSQLLNQTETVTAVEWIHSIFYGDNITFYCNTEINYTLEDVPQNDILSFQVRFQNTQQKSDYLSHEYDIEWQRVTFLFYFMLYVIIPIALFVIIRPYGIKRSRIGRQR